MNFARRGFIPGSALRWLTACLAVAWTFGSLGCASLSRLIDPGVPKVCKLGDDCYVPLGLKLPDPTDLNVCVLLLDFNTVQVDQHVTVTWSFKPDVGKVLRFKPINQDGSTAGAGIDIVDDPKREDFINPYTDGTKFSWTANSRVGKGIEHQYQINVTTPVGGADIPCKLDPIIVNEG